MTYISIRRSDPSLKRERIRRRDQDARRGQGQNEKLDYTSRFVRVQVVDEAGMPRHTSDKRHVREGCGRTDGLSIPKHNTHVLLVASSHCVEHSRVTWKIELKMRATDRSASRGPARWTETTPVATVMAWDCTGGWLPQNILGARWLVVVAMCGNSAVPKVQRD